MWLFNSDFVDYSNLEDLVSSFNDPLDCWNGDKDYMTKSMIALNGYGLLPHSVLVYDFNGNKIRLIDTIAWGHHSLDWKPSDKIDRQKSQQRKDMICGNVGSVTAFWDNLPYYYAPTFFRDLLRRYRDASLIPWPVLSEEEKKEHQQLLLRYGWPNEFEANEFRAALFRHNNRASTRGHANLAYTRLTELEGSTSECGNFLIGRIETTKARLLSTFGELSATPASSSEARWRLEFDHKYLEIELMSLYDELDFAKKTIRRLCPQGVCMPEKDLRLHGCANVEQQYNKLLDRQKRGSKNVGDEIWLGQLSDEKRQIILEWRDREVQWARLAYEHCTMESPECCNTPEWESFAINYDQFQQEELMHMLRDEIQTGEKIISDWKPWIEALPEDQAEISRPWVESEISRQESTIRLRVQELRSMGEAQHRQESEISERAIRSQHPVY